MILEKITDAKDLKQLNRSQLHTLVDEARTALLNKISQHGELNTRCKATVISTTPKFGPL